MGLPPGVKGILSVDIGAWDKKGRKVRKEAFNCTDQEIAETSTDRLSESGFRHHALGGMRLPGLVMILQ